VRRLALPLVLLLLTAGATVASRPPLVAAHRGGAGLWPENSLAAFRGAVALGVDALEFDVHLTADGEAVVIHDATLERTTTGQGAVRSATLAQIKRLRLIDRSGIPTTEPVPTLAEVLDLARPTTVAVLPEIKLDVARTPYPGVEERVLELLRVRGLVRRAVVQSFDDGTLRRVREREPGARTMLLVGRARGAQAAGPADIVRRAVDLGAGDLGIDHRLVDAPLIAAARAAGVRVSAWTVNAEDDLRRMRAVGVDLVMSDFPDRARRLLVNP
jgi:glycerophosphoryl diester phosphodiesterase